MGEVGVMGMIGVITESFLTRRLHEEEFWIMTPIIPITPL
jgi:hypothetical protein